MQSIITGKRSNQLTCCDETKRLGFNSQPVRAEETPARAVVSGETQETKSNALLTDPPMKVIGQGRFEIWQNFRGNILDQHGINKSEKWGWKVVPHVLKLCINKPWIRSPNRE